jgi:hypothetical protein
MRHRPPIYRLQPEASYNSLIYQLHLEGGSNLKEATTPCVLQLQLEGGYDPLIYRIQPEGNSNSLISLAPTRRRLQPPFLCLSYHPEI